MTGPNKKNTSKKKAPAAASTNGRGGKREGSGRKPKAITLFIQKVIGWKKSDFEYALALHVGVMKDRQMPLDIRLQAAKEVMDRIGGKPKQAVEHSGELKQLLLDG